MEMPHIPKDITCYLYRALCSNAAVTTSARGRSEGDQHWDSGCLSQAEISKIGRGRWCDDPPSREQ